MKVRIPKGIAEAMGCKVETTASIVQPPGGPQNPKNTSSADDTASATGQIPANVCTPTPPPPQAGQSNLKITNTFSFCASGTGTSIQCEFRLKVSNPPPGFSGTVPAGVLKVQHMVPTGTTVELIPEPPLPIPQAPAWNCAGDTCTLSHDGIGVGGFLREVRAIVNVPRNVAQALGCNISTTASIIDPAGPPHNTKSDDDSAPATGPISSQLCQWGAESNLQIITLPWPDASTACTKTTTGPNAGGSRCAFYVRVVNPETAGTFSGDVVVDGKLSTGALVNFFHIPTGTPAACTGIGNTPYTCTFSSVSLTPGASMNVNVFVDDQTQSCKVTNYVKIAQPPGGTLQNKKSFDDVSSAEALTTKCAHRSAKLDQCPPGWQWTRRGCERRRVVDIKAPVTPMTPIGDPPPPTGAPPPAACPKGQVASNGHCCPAGKHWVGGRCPAQAATPACTSGTKLIGGKCQCPQGTSWSERQDRCVAAGQAEKTKSCSGGRVWVGGQCRCPSGTSWTSSRCERRGQVKVDRPGFTGKTQSQGKGPQIQFRPLPNLKGPVRR